MRCSLGRPIGTTHQKTYNPLSGCASSGCISSACILLAVFGCRKHPPDAKLVVQRSINTKEHLFQWVGDFSFFGELLEKSRQLLERSSTQKETNRVAANGSLVKP